jgi:hypothetical protein
MKRIPGSSVYLHNGEQQRVVVGGNAGGELINDGILLVAAPSPEGGGVEQGLREQGGGQRGPRGYARTSLVLRGSEQLGPNGLSGAGHTRGRHGTNDIGKATNGSSGGETGDWRRQVQTTRSHRGKRTPSVEIAVHAAAVMTAAMAVRAVQGGTRRFAEAEKRRF